jgi:hypothetical protein
MGSDHDVYQDSSFGIPAIYLNDWPDRYIHTNFDTAANIDPTKLKRAAFIGAASAYFLGRLTPESASVAGRAVEIGNPWLEQQTTTRRISLSARDLTCAGDYALRYETGILNELDDFIGSKGQYLRMDGAECPSPEQGATPGASTRFRRNAETKGPLAVFGYDYFANHAKVEGVATPKLLSYEGLWGRGEEYAYEVLNFADGKRKAQEIRDAVSAEYGPVPLELVVEYLQALEKIGVVEELKNDVKK